MFMFGWDFDCSSKCHRKREKKRWFLAFPYYMPEIPSKCQGKCAVLTGIQFIFFLHEKSIGIRFDCPS